LFHNGNLFDSCIIHILYTGCAEIKKNNSGAKGLIMQRISQNYKQNGLLCGYNILTDGVFATQPSRNAGISV